jgi:hypothetical protein
MQKSIADIHQYSSLTAIGLAHNKWRGKGF